MHAKSFELLRVFTHFNWRGILAEIERKSINKFHKQLFETWPSDVEHEVKLDRNEMNIIR